VARIRARWTSDRATSTHYIGAGLAVGVVAALCAPTSYLHWFRDHGIWLIARVTPVYFHRSVVIGLLAIGGGLVAGALLLLSSKRDRWILSAFVLIFLAGQSPHGAEFERYYEPLVLMLLAIATSRIVSAGNVHPSRLWRMVSGLAVLTLLQIGYTGWLLSTPGPAGIR
jgi:hypothetical protein